MGDDGCETASCRSKKCPTAYVPYSVKVWRGKAWRIDSFGAFDERKFGELADQPIG